MTYKVTVRLEHPAYAPIQHEAEGPDSHTIESISAALLRAVGQAQRHIGATSTTDELGVVELTLDDLGVDASRSLSGRVRSLASQLVAAHEMIRAHGEVINGVRRSLDVSPQTRDEDLPDLAAAYKYADDELKQVVNQLSEQRDRLRRELDGAALRREATPEMLAEALHTVAMSDVAPGTLAVGWDPESKPEQARLVANLRRAMEGLRVVPSQTLLPVTAEELGRAWLETPSRTGPGFSWDEVPDLHETYREHAQRVLDSLPSFAAPKSSMPVSPEQLARAMHAARVVLTNESARSASALRPPLFLTVRWEELDARSREWFERVAERALSELPQIARADAESEASFVAHMDAVTSQLRREIANLRAEKTTALDALRGIAGVLGMSFGQADDARALGGTTLTAVRQLREAQQGDLDAASKYRGVLMSVIDQLGLPAKTLDDPMAFGKKFRAELEKRSGKTTALHFCAPKPEDWMVKLTPTEGPGDNGFLRAVVRHGVRANVNGVLCKVEFVYTGPDPVRPDGELLLPSVTAEQLAEAWFTVSTAELRGLVSVPWRELSEPTRTMNVDRARRVIERLATGWSDPARLRRDRGVVVPGEAFTFSLDGDLQKYRVFKAPDAPRVDEESIRAVFGGGSMSGSVKTDADAIARMIESLSGGRIRAVATSDASPSTVALLNQMGELGQHVQRLEAQKARRDARFMRLREITGINTLSGSTEDELVDSIAERYVDINDRMPSLIEENEALHSAAEELQAMTGTLTAESVVARVRDLIDFEREHRVCQGAAALQRELTGQLAQALGRAPEPPLGGEWGWGDLISQVSNTADWQRKAAMRAEDLGRALRLPEHASWDALVSHAAQANNAVRHLQCMLGLREQAYPGPLFKAVDDMKEGRDEATRLERNALAEICRILEISERSFPATVVDVVRNLKSSWDVMEEWYPRVVEALGVTFDTTADENIPTAVGKALDAVRDLKMAAMFRPGEWADPRRVRDAVFTVLEAAGIRDGSGDLSDVVAQKAGEAAAILRSWPDVVRAVTEFDGDEVEQPDEVAPMLMNFVRLFRCSDDYAGKLQAMERLLAAHRGEPLRKDADDAYERLDNMVKRLFAVVEETGRAHGLRYESGDSKVVFADSVLVRARNAVALSPAPVWASLAEQMAVRFESWAKANLDKEPMSKLVSVPGMGIKKDRQTLEFAAEVVRGHAAALLSGEKPHPLVMALQDNTFWALDSTVSDLELKPDTDGGVTFRASELAENLLRLRASEIAPVGAALLMLSMHHVREKGGELPAMPLRVVGTATMPQEWSYGPNAFDPDPGKRWHIGCGGEVLIIDGVDICGDCQYQWDPIGSGEHETAQAVEAAEQQETAVAESAPERDAAADEPDQDASS